MAGDHLSVTVTLDEVKPEIAIPSLCPTRTLTLCAPDWSVKIGRSTSSGTGPRQGDDNAWYSSRVVSREHAELRANPETREVLIRDAGSMHGTHVFGRRLKKGVSERLFEGDRVVFGAEVARGSDNFLPVEVDVSFVWSDGVYAAPEGSARIMAGARNYFTADYSDDDLDELEPESSVISVGDGSEPMPNNFAVPESDLSDEIISIISDDVPPSEEESPTSSPVESIIHGRKANNNKENERPSSVVGRRSYSPAPLPGDRPSPSLGDGLTEEDEIGEESDYEDSDVFDGDVGDIVQAMTTPSPLPAKSNLSAQAGFLSTPVSRRARDPSPSDAAMVKPAAERSPPFDNRLPPIQPRPSPPLFQASWEDFFPPPPERNASAWAGHNAVLYDTFPQSVVQETCFPSNPFDRPEMSSSALPNLDEMRRPQFNFDPEHQSNRIPPAPAPMAQAAAGQKRKADFISEDDVLVEDSIQEPAGQAAQENFTLSTIDPADLQPIVITETVESLKSPPSEPMKKKLKKHKHDSGSRKSGRRSTFAKYAATAIAGAAVGAVGTIWGLVTLPKDFFV